MKAGVAALMTVASMALVAAPSAEAHGVRAQVVIQAPVPPVAVFGFSYGDPYVMGHVHHGPVACSHGPLYYYPSYGVYSHYHPRYRYVRYARPHYLHRHHDASYRRGGWKQHASHKYRNDHRGRGDHRHKGKGRDRDRRGGYRIRGH
jgi:hypothetical protein